MEANVREAHYTPVTGKSCVSTNGSLSPIMASVVKVAETHNMVAAVQKLLQEDPISLVMAFGRQ